MFFDILFIIAFIVLITLRFSDKKRGIKMLKMYNSLKEDNDLILKELDNIKSHLTNSSEEKDSMKKLSLEYLKSLVDEVTYTKPYEDATTMVCSLKLKSGFVINGESACIDPNNYDEEIGKQVAYDNAIDQMWKLEGYKAVTEDTKILEMNELLLVANEQLQQQVTEAAERNKALVDKLDEIQTTMNLTLSAVANLSITINPNFSFTLFDKVLGELKVDANDLLKPSSLIDKLKPKKPVVPVDPDSPVEPTPSVINDVVDAGGKIINDISGKIPNPFKK